MANTNLKDYQANAIVGLGTYTYNVLVAGIYAVSAVSQVLPPSGLSIVINQNGSPIATSNPPSNAQSHIELLASHINCAVSDAITIVFSSSNANDLMLNTVDSLVTINLTNA